MSYLDSKGSTRVPQDLVAIFHASFHPTRGNVLDWTLKASDDLSLDGVEFSCLPSGLHLVEQDVVYFTKDEHQGVCIFRRRPTTEHGHRGFRLSSLGILLAKSARPRAWRHVSDLKDLIRTIYTRLETNENLEPRDKDWEPARLFFETRKVKRADLGGAGDWNGWADELNGSGTDAESINPALHTPHLLRILGPSCLTLYKHVLGRRRVLIYTLPPVEAACILSQVAADICMIQSEADGDRGANYGNHSKGKSKEAVNVLGMVTLSDVDKLYQLGKSGAGWIACTTDALFMDRPAYYDLLIDLTTSTPSKATRPTLYVSKPIRPAPAKGQTHRLSVVRFMWSDVKLWNELDRLLRLDDCDTHDHASTSTSSWTDVWRVYEDVCVVCAGLWMGSWRGNSRLSYSTINGAANWGSIRLDGDDDLTIEGSQIRNLGLGIEGRPENSSSGSGSRGDSTLPKAIKRWTSSSAKSIGSLTSATAIGDPDAEIDSNLKDQGNRSVQVTLLLLQTFHTHTSFLLSRVSSFIPLHTSADNLEVDTVYLKPRDMLSFELGPMSELDGNFVEWLAEVYGGGKTRFVVRRGWRDLLGLVWGVG